MPKITVKDSEMMGDDLSTETDNDEVFQEELHNDVTSPKENERSYKRMCQNSVFVNYNPDDSPIDTLSKSETWSHTHISLAEQDLASSTEVKDTHMNNLIVHMSSSALFSVVSENDRVISPIKQLNDVHSSDQHVFSE